MYIFLFDKRGKRDEVELLEGGVFTCDNFVELILTEGFRGNLQEEEMVFSSATRLISLFNKLTLSPLMDERGVIRLLLREGDPLIKVVEVVRIGGDELRLFPYVSSIPFKVGDLDIVVFPPPPEVFGWVGG